MQVNGNNSVSSLFSLLSAGGQGTSILENIAAPLSPTDTFLNLINQKVVGLNTLDATALIPGQAEKAAPVKIDAESGVENLAAPLAGLVPSTLVSQASVIKALDAASVDVASLPTKLAPASALQATMNLHAADHSSAQPANPVTAPNPADTTRDGTLLNSLKASLSLQNNVDPAHAAVVAATTASERDLTVAKATQKIESGSAFLLAQQTQNASSAPAFSAEGQMNQSHSDAFDQKLTAVKEVLPADANQPDTFVLASNSADDLMSVAKVATSAADILPQQATHVSSVHGTGDKHTHLEAPATQVMAQIERHLGSGKDRITVQLQPEELGRVEVRVDLRTGDDAARHARITVTADNSNTLFSLQNDSKELIKSLHQVGIKVDQDSIDFNLNAGGEHGPKFAFNHHEGFKQNQTTQTMMTEDTTSTVTNEVYAGPYMRPAGAVGINLTV